MVFNRKRNLLCTEFVLAEQAVLTDGRRGEKQLHHGRGQQVS